MFFALKPPSPEQYEQWIAKQSDGRSGLLGFSLAGTIEGVRREFEEAAAEVREMNELTGGEEARRRSHKDACTQWVHWVGRAAPEPTRSAGGGPTIGGVCGAARRGDGVRAAAAAMHTHAAHTHALRRRKRCAGAARLRRRAAGSRLRSACWRP